MIIMRRAVDEKLEAEAEKLKRLCDHKGREIDLSKTTPILHKIGLLYEEKYDVTGVELDLIRCAGLLNAALIRDPDNKKIQQDLQKFCSQILVRAGAEQINANLVVISQKASKELNQMRKETVEALESLGTILRSISSDKKAKLQQKTIVYLSTLQKLVTARYTKIMDFISKKCVTIMGKAPCQFTLVGMGSLARNEITPYSDFESIIVLEEGAQTKDNYDEILKYFRWYSVIFQVILVNLKETILRFLAIPCLNDDTKKGGDWFYDAYTPCGVCPDGFAAHACKNPLGRQEHTKLKNWTTELIKPVSEMVKFLDEEEDLKNGYYLGDLLTKSCFVSGDQGLWKQFAEAVKAKLSEDKASNHKLMLGQIEKTLQTFDIMTHVYKIRSSSICDIKRAVYRGLTLLLSAMGRMHLIDEFSCFDIVYKLQEKKVLSEEDSHYLAYAVAIACQLRLRMYTSKDSQEDMMGEKEYYSYDASTVRKELVALVGEKSLIDYFYTTYSLQQAVVNKLNRAIIGKSKLFIHYQVHNRFALLFMLHLHERAFTEWEEYKEIIKKIGKIAPDCRARLWVVMCNLAAEKYEDGLKINKWFDENDITDEAVLRQIEEIKPKVMITNGVLLYYLKRYDEALKHMKEIKPVINNQEVSEAKKSALLLDVFGVIADCSYKLGLVEESCDASKELLKYVQVANAAAKDITRANVLIRHGWLMISQQHYGDAMKAAEEALEICQKENAQIEWKCICYNIMGFCHYSEGRYQLALNCFLQELLLHYIHQPEDDYNNEKTNTAKKMLENCVIVANAADMKVGLQQCIDFVNHMHSNAYSFDPQYKHELSCKALIDYLRRQTYWEFAKKQTASTSK